MTQLSRPRQPKGTSEGGRWKSTSSPDNIIPMSKLGLQQPGEHHRNYTPSQGDRFTFKINGKQRSVRYDNGNWKCKGLLADPTMRKFYSEFSGSTDEALEVASVVATQMLENGDITPLGQPHMNKGMINGILRGKVRGWPEPATIFDYPEAPELQTQFIELSAIAYTADLLSQTPAYKSDPLLKNIHKEILENQFSRPHMEHYLFPTADMETGDNFWCGQDGKLIERMMLKSIDGTSYYTALLADPLPSNKNLAPLAAYLLATTEPDTKIHKRAMWHLNNLSRIYEQTMLTKNVGKALGYDVRNFYENIIVRAQDSDASLEVQERSYKVIQTILSVPKHHASKRALLASMNSLLETGGLPRAAYSRILRDDYNGIHEDQTFD